VLQVTLSKESFGDLDDIVQLCLDYPSLYGVIFLAYKEVGRGSRYHQVLSKLDPLLVHDQLRTAFLTLSQHMRVGYDCCLTPAMVGLESDLGFAHDDQLEGCSAMRSSIGVLPNLDVTPCTFLPNAAVGNLHEQPLAAIWRGRPADRFRLRMAEQMSAKPACRGCATQSDCLGGCPAFDLVRCAQSVSPPPSSTRDAS